MRFLLLMAFGGIALLVMGGQMLVTAFKNREPLKLSCTDVSKKMPQSDWLQLENCIPDMPNSAHKGVSDSDVENVYIPLLDPNDREGSPRIVVVTDDVKWKGAYLDGSKVETEDQAVDYMAKYMTPTTFAGVVQWGFDLDDSDRSQLQGISPNLADRFLMMEHNKEPSLLLGTLMSLGGIALLIGTVLIFVAGRDDKSEYQEAQEA